MMDATLFATFSGDMFRFLLVLRMLGNQNFQALSLFAFFVSLLFLPLTYNLCYPTFHFDPRRIVFRLDSLITFLAIRHRQYSNIMERNLSPLPFTLPNLIIYS